MLRRRLLALASQTLTLREAQPLGATAKTCCVATRGLAEAAAVPELKKTPLYDFHVKNSGACGKEAVRFCDLYVVQARWWSFVDGRCLCSMHSR